MNDVHIVTVFNLYDVTSYLFATETETLTLTLTHILTSHDLQWLLLSTIFHVNVIIPMNVGSPCPLSNSK